MPEEYFYDRRSKELHVRQQNTFLGRVHSVNLLAGEVFYLRLLLHNDHCRGKVSFEDFSSINGTLHESYQAVCRELGHLCDDQEWENFLSYDFLTNICPQIRNLYVILLIFCFPQNPAKLFEDIWMYWTDDFVKRYMPLNLSDDQLKT